MPFSVESIEATNEARRDFELSKDGMHLVGDDGLHNMPEHPKCWYQFGQRIVGWSRVAQNVVMQLVAPHVEEIIYGDTDSLKLYLRKDKADDMQAALDVYYRALDASKIKTCERVRRNFPEHYDSLDGIGAYIVEGEFSHFCASWNKCYVSYDGNRLDMTIAGLPTGRGIEGKAAWMMDNGADFSDVANLFIGYNVTYDYMLTMLNSRSHPQFGEMFAGNVTDYLGNEHHVYAPAALALYPESKTIGDTDKPDNAVNASYAYENNQDVNLEPVLRRRCDMTCARLDTLV